MFVSQNSDTTPIIRRAYDFDEGIIESGYPRNDELHDPDPSRVADIRAAARHPGGQHRRHVRAHLAGGGPGRSSC